MATDRGTRGATERRLPVAAMRSDEAMFETYRTDSGGIMLVMRPHGIEKGDDREVGWALTWAEVEGLQMLLSETMPEPSASSYPQAATGWL